MKPLSTHLPTEHLSRHDKRAVFAQATSPTTDQHYQTTVKATASLTSSKQSIPSGHAAALRSFRQFGALIDDKGSRWSYVLETVVLGLVSALVAWPLISLLIVLAQTARG
jgi:hypothetical protein